MNDLSKIREKKRNGIFFRLFRKMPPRWRERVWESLNPGGCWVSDHWPKQFASMRDDANTGALCAMVLASEADRLGVKESGTYTVRLWAHSHQGEVTGDWEIVIRRFKEGDLDR